jgi:hypothetical protein
MSQRLKITVKEMLQESEAREYDCKNLAQLYDCIIVINILLAFIHESVMCLE